ncbi:hypothetical protein GI582_20940 [Sulfitobacter sp. BDSS02]|nr:hypothetical protein [Sulfitobacter sp. BDSS02]MBR9851845.1 hypothetical protein [Paracoccaceae bacterium]
MKEFDLIHIGHGKCLSTFMQERWNRSDRYNFFNGVTTGDALSKAFMAGARSSEGQKIDINLSTDKPNVLSYECFTYFGCAEDTPEEYRHLTLERQAFIAATLSHLSRTALLILRNPVDWIRSAHAQYIKYGGSLNLQGYFSAFRTPLLDNLRLDRILPIWRDNGFEPVVLAMEDYTRDPERFWRQYEALTELPAPHDIATDAQSDNRTDHGNLETRAATNALIDTLIGAMERNQLYKNSPPHQKELESLSTVNEHFRRWTLRRAFEAMGEEEFDDLRSQLALSEDQSFRELALDSADADLLAECYLEPLREFSAFEPYVESYRKSLIAAAA